MAKNHFISGDWNVTCDVCSKKIKAQDAKQRWDGFIVCPDDFEHRQPQDFVKAKTDKITVPFTRPRPLDAFKLVNPLTDTIIISDDNDFDNYIVTQSDYFAQDYLVNFMAFSVIVNWKRTLSDSVLPTEILVLNTKKTFVDSVIVSDSIFPRITITRAFADSTTPSDSGSIFWENYVESTYFASDYVGTTSTF